MAWVDLSASFSYGSKLTSAQMQNLRDNLTALANGDSGAPPIQTAALDTGIVTSVKLEYLAGDTRQIDAGGPNSYYEVLGADGNWGRTCPNFNDGI